MASRRLPDLDDGVKKRVRLALSAGDREQARREIAKVVQDEADVDALYAQHLREEEEREAREEYERTVGAEELEDELLASLNSLSLNAVPCPVCEKGSLRETIASPCMITCTICDLRLTAASLEACTDALANALLEHSSSCEASNRPQISSLKDTLALSCKNCGIENEEIVITSKVF